MERFLSNEKFPEIYITLVLATKQNTDMYARPKPGETEEDLLKLQEEFLKQKAENKIKPAAKLSKSENGAKSNNVKKTSQEEIVQQLSNTFEEIPSHPGLGRIVEKAPNIEAIKKFEFNSSRGFPQAKRRDIQNASGKKGSIFAQSMKKLKPNDPEPMETDAPEINQSSLTIKPKSQFPEQSFILTGTESKEIHEENIKLLQTIPEKEILEEKQKLIETMDPAIIAFLKSRRQNQKVETRNRTIQEQNKAAEGLDLREIETTSEILTQPSSEKWLNFDIVETNKLAWMKSIDIPKIDKNSKFEARFDFEGWLLPFAEPEVNEKNRILYHHGEEPGRPGYTLQELFQLSRSSVIQQKIIALNTIANILSLQSTGVYDEIIDIPIEQIFFVLRFCLDDNTPTVLNASIKALRNLFFNKIDETCLDSILGFGFLIQPTLSIDNENEDDNTVNDQQLAETDLIKCLARTEILTRIRYIINTVKPSTETIVYCLEILCRLSRDSMFILNKVYKTEGLIESIIKHFVPKTVTNNNSPYGTPLQQAIKFLRIISCRRKDIAFDLIHKCDILFSIMGYLSNDYFSSNANGMKLQTECLNLWNVFVKYNLGLAEFESFQSVFIQMLEYHFNNTELNMQTTFVRQGLVAGLLNLLSSVFTVKRLEAFWPKLHDCALKWIKQFSVWEDYATGKLQILSGLLNCFGSFRGFYNMDELVLFLLKSKGFNKITEDIVQGSMLLNNYQTFKSSSNLKSVEVAAWFTADHVVPIIQTKSCIPFLASLSTYLKGSSNQVKLEFLQNHNVRKYLESLRKLELFYLTNHWFTRMESFLIMDILEMAIELRKDIETDLFYELAVKSLGVFNAEQKGKVELVLRKIVFCPDFYPGDVLLNNLHIDKSENLNTSLDNLNEILDVYIQVLGLNMGLPDFSTSLCLDISLGNIIPIDWIYTPILVLYSNSNQPKDTKAQPSEERQIYIIKNCLRWILIYDTYFPSLSDSINPTDKFCRLACVFLGSDNLFLNNEIHKLLELCFKNLIRKSQVDLNFNKQIQGLSNFQDFYTQLLEQYQAVSYGDVLFGNVILVPLAQKHKKQFKKTLWSEYMGAVQVFNVKAEEIFGDLQQYLEPPEEDLSLLRSYQKGIMTGAIRKHSVLFVIAQHHIKYHLRKNVK